MIAALDANGGQSPIALRKKLAQKLMPARLLMTLLFPTGWQISLVKRLLTIARLVVAERSDALW